MGQPNTKGSFFSFDPVAHAITKWCPQKPGLIPKGNLNVMKRLLNPTPEKRPRVFLFSGGDVPTHGVANDRGKRTANSLADSTFTKDSRFNKLVSGVSFANAV